MKKLNRKQRGEIYLEVLNRIDMHGCSHLCPMLKEKLDKDFQVQYQSDSINYLEDYFPEFMLFDCKRYIWFSFDEFTNPDEPRIIIMLLCYYMTLKP